MGILDSLFGKKKKEQERIAREKASMENDMAKQVWEQFGRATNRRVVTTGHLLFLQQLVGDAFFAYKHASDTSKYPSYMWADKQLFLGDNSKVAYTVPFLWIRTMAKTNVPKFNETMDLLNNEYRIIVEGYDVDGMLNIIKKSGFYQFQPNFDINANKVLLSKFCKDSACLLRFINFFGDNINMRDMLPTQSNRVSIPSASRAINEVINEMVDAFRKGTLSK